MKVAIAGASGLIGGALTASLRHDGHEVVRLVRRTSAAPDEVAWDPKAGTVDAEGLAGCDAVVNLAAAGVGDRPWTKAYRREIRDSRVLGTAALARAVTALEPAPNVFLVPTAIGWYGDTGERAVDETAPHGTGFLADVVEQWERAADPARQAGIRVVHPRSGLVVSHKGGAWGRLWPLFRLGVGGRFGDGSQYWSFVSLRDEVAALRRMIDDDTMNGAYNVTAPNPVTNREITKAMGRLLHRPTVATVPAFVLRTVLGDLSQEVLGSLRVLPHRLTEAGFAFRDPTIDDALRAALADAR